MRLLTIIMSVIVSLYTIAISAITAGMNSTKKTNIIGKTPLPKEKVDAFNHTPCASPSGVRRVTPDGASCTR